MVSSYPAELRGDLKVCRQTFKAHSKTYYYSAHLLGAATRSYVDALYAFFRLPDEYVDNPVADPATELTCFRAEYERVWRTGRSSEPVLRAFHATAQLFGIPREWPDAFLDSMEMDLTVGRYETYEDLRRYVYGSAEVVGLMMAKVLGVPPEGYPAARALGLAMQLTNFYRDIGEDWVRGRIYVPLEDLDRFRIPHDEWNDGLDPQRFRALMRFQSERNLRIYRDAHDGFRYIPWQSRLAVALSSAGYQRTLQCVMNDPMVVWKRRLSRRKTDYLPILYGAWNAAYVH